MSGFHWIGKNSFAEVLRFQVIATDLVNDDNILLGLCWGTISDYKVVSNACIPRVEMFFSHRVHQVISQFFSALLPVGVTGCCTN